MHRVHSAAHSKFIHPVPEDAREGAAPASCASRSSSTQHSLILFFRNHYILGEKKALRNLTLQWFACVLRRLRKRMRVRNPVHDCHLVILRWAKLQLLPRHLSFGDIGISFTITKSNSFSIFFLSFFFGGVESDYSGCSDCTNPAVKSKPTKPAPEVYDVVVIGVRKAHGFCFECGALLTIHVCRSRKM